jgi:ankyrin repeat protein
LVKSIDLLVSLGEDVNATDSYGITSLMVAANLGDLNVVKFLVEKGADLNGRWKSATWTV